VVLRVSWDFISGIDRDSWFIVHLVLWSVIGALVSGYWCWFFMGFSSVLKKGNRIALRSKVNDSLITGIALVDSLLPVGRGQRQLILGDRSTGKTSIFLTCILVSLTTSAITSIDGFGSRRLFMVYVAINQNLSKISTIINKLGSL